MVAPLNHAPSQALGAYGPLWPRGTKLARPHLLQVVTGELALRALVPETPLCENGDLPTPAGYNRGLPSGSNSVGRVSASQAECRGFEPRLPLQSPIASGIKGANPPLIQRSEERAARADASVHRPAARAAKGVVDTLDRMLGTDPTASTASAAPVAAASAGAIAPVAAVELRDVHRSFGAVTAVDGIDLRLELGEIAALLGPNGAGKTTTIDMILGLGRPDRGTVSVLGMAPSDAIARGLVAAVLQTGGLLKDITVRETVRLTASLYVDARPVDEVLERAGVLAIADRLVGACSGGEQQRLRFALALLPDPALMALDEPTSGMDVEGRRDFWTAIRRDAAQGRTVLFATHYLEEADAYADRIILLREGRIVADGTAAEVRSLSSGRSVRANLPGADQAALEKLPGVRSVELRGDRVLIQTTDSDAVARYLLTSTPARELEVVTQNLEDAFLALTGDDAPPASPQLVPS
jgi:ABC-type multidrug transport system ATPase subunit